LAYFITVELFPSLAIESFEKVVNVHRVYEVNESVAHVAPVLEVDGQVKEIVLVFLVAIYSLQQHFLTVFIWNVFYHY
jgi:hypothetical protein